MHCRETVPGLLRRVTSWGTFVVAQPVRQAVGVGCIAEHSDGLCPSCERSSRTSQRVCHSSRASMEPMIPLVSSKSLNESERLRIQELQAATQITRVRECPPPRAAAANPFPLDARWFTR